MGYNYKQATTVYSRFWKRVEKTNGCWIFHSSSANGGYGRVVDTTTHKPIRAHRISWEIHNGPIPDGMEILHKCDNPPCVNPEHLYLGTQIDNMRDRRERGRCGYSGNPGEKHPRRKLTEEQVREIKFSNLTQNECVDKFHINQRTVSAIRCNKLWKHITKTPLDNVHRPD